MAQAFGDRSPLSFLHELEILKSIIENLADGVIVANRQGDFIYFNRVAQSILGIGATASHPNEWSQVYGCYLPDGVTPYPPTGLPLARALAGEIVGETDIFIRNEKRPGGLWIRTRANPLRDQSGEVCGGVVVLSDITAKRESDLQIQTLTNAVEQTADAIVITTSDGTVRYVNPAFEKSTGYTKPEILGGNPRILRSGVHDAAFYQNMWATLSSGQVFSATITNRKKNGEIYFAEQTITPMKDAAGNITHYVAVTKDVTEQRKLQEQEIHMKLARAVQQRLYRVPLPHVEGFDIAGAAFPADATGGDYFDFVPLPRGCVGISIGDVAGHGIGSALLMAELRACLRAFARKSLNVCEIFTLVNEVLVSDLEQDRYATLALCRLHPPSRTLVYASAGHVPGYILDADGAVKQILHSTDIPLGILADHQFSCSDEIKLKPGEMLALLTDGITEAERPDQTQFGTERALQFIREHRHESARKIVAGLYLAVRDFSNGLTQVDDITAVICKAVNGNGRKRRRNGARRPK